MTHLKRPMLAADLADWNYDFDRIPYPVLASHKIDGIRCLITPDGARTRSMKPIRNEQIARLLEHKCPVGYDGELIHPTSFQLTDSIVMSKDHSKWGEIEYRVFDNYSFGILPFIQRQNEISPNFLLPQAHIYNSYDLQVYEAGCLRLGYEGVMLRLPSAPYKQGRSTLREFGLVKLKRFLTADAVIVSYVEEQANTNPQEVSEIGLSKRSHAAAGMVPKGTLGALVVREPDGTEFNIGSGFTAADRQTLWATREALVGKTVEYKYLPHGIKDKPRHPVFLRFRNDV